MRGMESHLWSRMRLGVSPARGPEASGWETRFFCSMKGRVEAVAGVFLFGTRAGVGILLYGVEWGRAMFSVRWAWQQRWWRQVA